MLKAITQMQPRSPARTERGARLGFYAAVLDGTLYDPLPHDFADERNGAGEYVPLRLRQPSVRYNLCRLVVEDSVSLLFGEGRFPKIGVVDDTTKETLTELIEESELEQTMCEAATIGSVGSVAILMRVLKGRVFWETMRTDALTPVWDPEEPDRLLRVTERYIVRGKALTAMGYPISADNAEVSYWFQREWNDLEEVWFLPAIEADGDKPMSRDTTRTVAHQLGFVPVVWIRNLLGGDGVDGACTFKGAISTQIEIEYRMSQGGRALTYASDPLMMIRDPVGSNDGDMVRSASNAIVVGEGGDAKMIEIDGGSTEAIQTFCRALRDMALEAMHGNRSLPEKISVAQSGRALEMMFAPLVNLCDRLRQSYGRGLKAMLKMVVEANQRYELRVMGSAVSIGTLKRGRINLQWGDWFSKTLHDKQIEGQTIGQLKRDGLLSRESAVEEIAEDHGIVDPAEEVARIVADIEAADARAQRQSGVQVRATEQLEQ